MNGAHIYQLMVLTAWSDGQLHARERDVATRLLERTPELAGLTGREQLAAEAREKLDRLGVRGAVDALAADLLEPEARELALRCCALVLAADGRLAREEFAVMSQLLRCFGLTAADLTRIIEGARRG